MSTLNVYSMFTKVKKKIVIVMDDIDGMSSGDKGGINSLIKIIRPKKTKKQKREEISMVPIICIGHNQADKKIKELVAVCYSMELNTPKAHQIKQILDNNTSFDNGELFNSGDIINIFNNDLRKLVLFIEASKIKGITLKTIKSLFSQKIYFDDIKDKVKNLIKQKNDIKYH